MRSTRLLLTLAASSLLTLTLAGCPIPEGSSSPGGKTTPGGSSGVTPGKSGALDATFGDDGIVTTDFTEGKSDFAMALALQPDGKIVAGGTTSAPSPSYTVGTFALIRYQANGEPDAGFGTVGRVFTAQGSTAQGRAVAVAGDGTIVTGGWMQGSGFAMDFLMSRHLANGKLDDSFGTGGHATAGYGGATGNALALQADGKILFAGYNGLLEYKPIVLRYAANGTLDPAFDGDGKLQLDWGSDDDQAEAIAVRDGKILVAGSAGAKGFALSRLNMDGSLDTSFGTNGTVTLAAGDSLAEAMAVAPDGAIVLAGGKHVVRITPGGALDESFGEDGIVQLPDHALRAVAVQSDGKVLVTGGKSDKVVLVRLKANGAVDSGFAAQGTALEAVPGGIAEAYAIVIQPDGRIVVAGRALDGEAGDDDFMLMRFWP